MNANLLIVSNLCVEQKNKKLRGRKIIDNVSLSLSAGEVLGVVGEAGAGKSVLVRSLLGLLPEDLEISQGSINYDGVDLIQGDRRILSKIRGKEIAAILADAKMQLNPVVRIGKIIEDVVKAHQKVSNQEARQKAIEALKAVGINDPEMRIKAYPHELSGGMAQRVCVAIALIHNPNLIIADEPTFGLDVTVQRSVLDQMSDLLTERGASQLIVTRDLGIVAHYCQKVIVMKSGRIVESGSIREIFNNPKDLYTKHLLNSVGYVQQTSKKSKEVFYE